MGSNTTSIKRAKMRKSSIRDWLNVNRLQTLRLETGFSMLEAIVVVGVLLAIAVGGFFAYGPIVENAKIAKVKSTASQIHTAVVVYHSDGDPMTHPQDAIDNWNNSTDKIRVEILDSGAGVAAMTTTAPSQGDNGDFCVQAVNVKDQHIRARKGACNNAPTTTEPDMDFDGIPNSTDPDMDGDGIPNESDPDKDGDNIPNSSDPDMNGDGTPNTAWESFSVVQAAQAAGDEVSYTNPDGSTTTWNYTNTAVYGHEHEPISPYTLPTGKLDVLRANQSSASLMTVTVGTDGQLTDQDGAVGGSFSVFMHADLDCLNTSTAVVTSRSGWSGVNLDSIYTSNPGPNTGELKWACESNERIIGFALFPHRHSDWSDNPYGGFSFHFTRDQLVKWAPAE